MQYFKRVDSTENAKRKIARHENTGCEKAGREMQDTKL